MAPSKTPEQLADAALMEMMSDLVILGDIAGEKAHTRLRQLARDSAALGAVESLEEAASAAYRAKSTLGGGLVRVTVMNWLRNRAASYTKVEASHGTE